MTTEAVASSSASSVRDASPSPTPLSPTSSSGDRERFDVLVVGAGLSGLSLARALDRHPGFPAEGLLVAERQAQVGGNITTNQRDGFLWEEGPNSFSPTPELLDLLVDVGLREELMLADRKLPRYVYWRGELLSVPMSPPAAVGSKLLSGWGKLRALLGALGFVPPAMTDRESVDSFFRRHLGAEVAERLVQPFCSGVYAGDSSQLEACSAFARVTRLTDAGGGLVAGALLARKSGKSNSARTAPIQTKPGELGSFRQGLQQLPEAIAQQLGNRVRLQWHLKHLQRSDRGTYLADFTTPEGDRQVEARTVVLTTPAFVATELLQSLQVDVPNDIPYPPVACVVLAYPKTAVKGDLRGFGNLIPRGQGIRTLGTIWSSSLFPGRTPEGWHVLTNFIGGATDPDIATLDPKRIADLVHQDLQKILLAKDVQPEVLAVRLWKQAIPQYNLGHAQRVSQMQAAVAKFPGLYLCANYLDGVALGDCVRRGYDLAPQIVEYVRNATATNAQA